MKLITALIVTTIFLIAGCSFMYKSEGSYAGGKILYSSFGCIGEYEENEE